MSKNIEKIKGEEAISEIVSVTLDDEKLNGLVSNDVADMYQSASGLKPIKPIDTYESPIVELKANLKLIFRRLFSVPLTILGSNKGASPISIIKMMEHMFNHYRERLKGSEKYGIPSRLSQLTDLPSAPAMLADRKISGVPEAADGISLVQLLLKEYASVTELLDDNTCDVLPRDLKTLTDLFPNVHKLTLGMEEIRNRHISSANLNGITEFNVPNLKRAIFCCVDRGFRLPTLTMPELTIYQGGNSSTGGYIGMVNGDTTVTKIECPKMKEFYFGRFAVDCTSLKEVITDIEVFDEYGGYLYMLVNCPNVEKLVFGKLRVFRMTEPQNRSGISNSAYLIHLEVGAGTAVSLDLRSWKPTTALSDNLQQFLQNFRDYIAERLTDKGTGLTLTLSQEVRNAIHAAEDEYGIENIIITQKGWTISPAPN